MIRKVRTSEHRNRESCEHRGELQKKWSGQEDTQPSFLM